MVYSIRWRTQAKKILLSLILFTYVNPAFADFIIGISSIHRVKKHTPSGINSYVSDDMSYNPTHGAYTGTRSIKYSEWDDDSRYDYLAISAVYEDSEWESTISSGKDIFLASLGLKYWIFSYGVQVLGVEEYKKFTIEDSTITYSCLIDCSYIKSLESMESQNREEEESYSAEYYNFYLGINFMIYDIALKLNTNGQFSYILTGYSFN